jgi:hypothetical protein
MGNSGIRADHPQGRLIVNALAALGARACVRLVWKRSRLFFFSGCFFGQESGQLGGGY